MAKVLIIRLTSLGDVILTIPLACELKKDDASTKIGWVVAEKGLGVIKNNPCVDNIHFVPLGEWKKRPLSLKTFKEFFEIIKEIRKEKYDIALDCQQMFKSLFLFWFCGAKRRITFKDARELSILGGNEFITPKAKFRDFNYHIVERNLDFARHLGIEPDNIEFAMPETSSDAKNKINELTKKFDNTKPIAVISPATTWKNKHWAEENWAEVIEAIHEKCNLVLTGNDADKPLIQNILNKVNKNINYTNLAGETNIEELRELFSRSKLVISPDSGSANLAWASSNPAVITIFTCTPPKRFGPCGDAKKYFSIGAKLPCQPCFKKKCTLKRGQNVCQKFPKSDEIINIVNNLL
ncbi:MAG: glycosyltransferase family 9 protein [Candidatus Gastranaerophilaceae bacterium]